MKFIWIALGIAGVMFLAALAWGLYSSNSVETPEYEVVSQSGDIEIRQYAPMIAAEATVTGEQDQAISTGFRIIADYIFGNNQSADGIAMTAPVTQQSGEEIAMTAPVTQQPSENIAMTAPVTQQSDGNSWKVRFIMPSKYTMETIPLPVNSDVKLVEVPSKRFAAIRFSGLAGESKLDRYTQELLEYMDAQKLTPVAAPQYAFYNDPWTLPFLRRNEVMIEIAE
jgi:hypothetical protein